MKNNRQGFGERLTQGAREAYSVMRDKLSQVMKSSAKSRAGGRMRSPEADGRQTAAPSGAGIKSTVPDRPAQPKFKVPFGFTHKKRFVAVLSGVVAAIMIPVLVSSAGGAGFYTSTGGTVNYAVPNHADTVSGSSGARAVTAYTQAVVRTDVAETSAAGSEEKSEPAEGSTDTGSVSSGKQGASVSLSAYEDADRDEPSPEPTEDPYMALEPGITNDDVVALQQRLMDLHYLENDEPTNYYGPQTQQAVGYFQRKHGLDVDGYAGPKTQDLLFSDEARPYTVSVGAQGADVWNIQERLAELGYPVNVTGYYGTQTERAVGYFQRMSGITDDGTVGIDTKDLLWSDTAEPAIPPEPDPEPEPEEETSGGSESSSGSSEGSSGSASSESSSSGSSESSSSGGSSSGSGSSKNESSSSSEESSGSSSSKEEEAPKKKEPSGGSNVPSASSGSVEAFVDAACAQEGKPYVLGGKGPNTFDCSGLVYYALNASGYSIGYMTSGGWAASGYPSISWDNLQRGDVLCFSGHVGVYLGGGMMCDASSSNGRIMIRSMGSWARNNFICGKRPLAA